MRGRPGARGSRGGRAGPRTLDPWAPRSLVRPRVALEHQAEPLEGEPRIVLVYELAVGHDRRREPSRGDHGRGPPEPLADAPAHAVGLGRRPEDQRGLDPPPPGGPP